MTITNDKYDLHDEDYSVQGWDAILAADMQIINDNLTARILGILVKQFWHTKLYI